MLYSFATELLLWTFVIIWLITCFALRCFVWGFAVWWAFCFVFLYPLVDVYFYFFGYLLSQLFEIFITFGFVFFISLLMNQFIDNTFSFCFLLFSGSTVMSFCAHLLSVLRFVFHHRSQWNANKLAVCQRFVFADCEWLDMSTLIIILLNLQHFGKIWFNFSVVGV